MNEFLLDWFWYLLAFAAGALVMYIIIGMVVPSKSPDEAFEDLPGAREIGDDR